MNGGKIRLAYMKVHGTKRERKERGEARGELFVYIFLRTNFPISLNFHLL